MKRKQKLPLPLQCVKDFEQEHPRCWEYIEDFREKRGKEVPCWNDLVYIPLIDANSIFKAKYNNGKNDINQASIYAAYAAWRQYKEIYSFSAELSEILFEQAEEDIIIPTEILYKIPYNSIYINVSDNEGFFVFFEQNVFTYQMELRFCCVEEHEDDTSITNVWVNLDEGNTVSDGIAKGLDGLKKYIGNVRYKIKIDGEYVLQTEQQMFAEMFRIVSRYIQLVLYICSENAEIEENPQQKQITRRPADNRPKDVFREIRSWDVGVKFAKNIKKSRQQFAEPTESERQYSGQGVPKRPHTRRGHWHHYWVGSDKDNSRKLILKWTAPMFVGGGSDDTIATVNKIE